MSKVIFFLIVGLSFAPRFLSADEPADAIHAFLSAPRSVFSGCASSVAELLKGDPDHTFTLVENRHNPWITDYRHTMQNGPIAIVFLEATEIDRCLLQQVDISGPQEVIPLAINIGAARREVIQTLGPPTNEYPGIDIYVVENLVGADRIIVRYETGVVSSFTWEYFID